MLEQRIKTTSAGPIALEMDSETARAEVTIADLRRQLRESRERIEALIVEAQTLRALLAQSQDLLQQQLFFQNAQVERLSEDLKEARTERTRAIGQLEETITMKNGHILHLEREISRLEGMITTKDRYIKTLAQRGLLHYIRDRVRHPFHLAQATRAVIRAQYRHVYLSRVKRDRR